MKNLIYLFTIILFLSCSNDDNENTTVANTSREITVLDATGSLDEVNVEEAKKIIYGKWDVSDDLTTSYVSSLTNENYETCAFDYIEFTDDNYLVGFLLDGEPEALFGTYDLNEDDNGFVTSVDLNFYNGDENLKIATLTNIVVEETNSKLIATFNVVFDLSEISEDAALCNNLEGDYTADKEEPMEESSSADSNSNHTLFVDTWILESVVENNIDNTTEFLSDQCLYYDPYQDEEVTIEACSPATKLTLSISTYGTYTFVFSGSSEGIKIETDVWEWVDDSQTSFTVKDEEEPLVITIESLSETQAVFSESYEMGTIYYTFLRNN